MAEGIDTQNIVVRNVGIADWARLVRLLKQLIHEKPPVALELEPLLFRTEEWIERFPGEDSGIFVVAENITENNIVGFCYLAKPSYRLAEAFIGIAVDKAYRRQNVGSMLFFRVAEWAARANLRLIITDVWDWNNESLDFFKKHGFRETEHFDAKFRGETRGKVRLVKEI